MLVDHTHQDDRYLPQNHPPQGLASNTISPDDLGHITNVLVVDNDHHNLRTLSLLLQGENYLVRIATSGQMALRSIQVQLPDLILLDVQMGGMNGFEVCTTLKQSPLTCEIPILFISASDAIEDKVKGFEVGGSDYITKPFQPQEVLMRVRHQLEIRSLQKQLEAKNAELRQAEERYRSIVENSIDGIFQSSPDGQYLSVNPALVRIYGYDSATALLANLNKIQERLYVNPHRRDEFVAYLQNHTMVSNFESQVHRADGSIIWISENARAVRDGVGNMLYYEGTVEDISDRKQAEIALQQTEEQLALVLRGSTDGWWDWDLVNDKIYYSPRWWEMLGYQDGALQPTTDLWQKWIHPADLDRVMADLNQQLASDVRSFAMECRLQHSQGHYLPVIVRAFISRDHSGSPVRVSGTNTDLTYLKQTEASLRQVLQYIEMHFDHSPLAIVEWGQDGLIQRWSRRAETLFGWQAAEVLGKGWDEVSLIYEDDRDYVNQELKRLLDGSITSLMLQNRNHTRDGRIVVCKWYSSAVFDESGRLASVLSFAEDITERFELERLKDEFVSIASHELRTPVTAIRGSLITLAAGGFDNQSEEAKQLIDIALRGSDRLIRLVNDILDLERLESGRYQLVTEPCCVADLIQQAVDLVQPLAQVAQTNIQTTFVEINFNANANAIVQVLTNLLSNAIKFSPTGGSIWLTVEILDEETHWSDGNRSLLASPHPLHSISAYLCFSVKDQGRGIPSNKLEVVFKRFQQVDASDSRQKGGTGLGLAICKSIVQQHRGQIWVESVPGEGSTFYFTLPL